MRQDSEREGDIGVILDLARPLARMIDVIEDYYKEPEHERAFQEWYLKRYGHSAPAEV